ncbi:MAG: flagellar export chaperone FlgN [Planctomycetota bacterium]|jgi:hypothetical protein
MTLDRIETKVDALLAVLDEEIRHGETTLSQLDVLRNLLIKRDDVALEQLLRDLHEQGQTRGQTERRRQELRQELADALGRDVKALTLSALQTVLSDPRRAAVRERQKRLRSQIGLLEREYALTRALVADCARFNRSLMRVFFGTDSDRTMTYGATGAVRHQTGAGMVSLHL